MNILHTSPLYYPSIGGNETLNQELSEKMVEFGEEVTVFTANATSYAHFNASGLQKEILPAKETINGVCVERFKINHVKRHLLLNAFSGVRGVSKIRKSLFKDSLEMWDHGPYVPAMLSAIHRLKPDVMLATNNYSATTYVCSLAKKRYNIPLVIIPLTHSADPWTHDPLLPKLYNAADLVITSTEFEKRLLMKQGVAEDKMKVIGHGIDIEKFRNPQPEAFKKKHGLRDDPVVAYIGRKVEGKGIETLIEAMRIVWQKHTCAQLLLAGSSFEKFEPILNKHLDQLTAEEKKKAFNINNFSDEEKKDVYAASDIFVMASNIDSFGLANLEAWASGLPIIVCKDTPQETLVADGEDGYFVEYANKEELAQAILKLLKDPAARMAMGNQGRKKVVENYTIDVYAQRIRETYQEVFRKNK